MTTKKLKQILKDAYTAGECDTYVEDTLIQSACDYIGYEVTDKVSKVTDEEHDKIINAYRMGFLGTDRRVAKYKKQIKQLKTIIINLTKHQ